MLNNCQLYQLAHLGDPLRASELLVQLGRRGRRIIKRRLRYLHNVFLEISGQKARALPTSRGKDATTPALQPGDTVCIRSREDIQKTLNRWNALKGCAFMEEMWPLCDTRQRVFKPVHQFLDERTYQVRKCNGVVLLEGVMCRGTKDFGPCDRSCFFFWREEWLKKID